MFFIHYLKHAICHFLLLPITCHVQDVLSNFQKKNGNLDMEKKHHLQAKLNLPMLMRRNNYIYIIMSAFTIQWAKKGVGPQIKIIKFWSILFFPFQAMIIMENNYFFIHLNVKEFLKNSFDEILGFNFWFWTFKSEYECVELESILQRTMKRTHIINHIWCETN